MSDTPTGPLAGVRVLDLSSVLLGPMGGHSREVSHEFGFDESHVTALMAAGAVVQAA